MVTFERKGLRYKSKNYWAQSTRLMPNLHIDSIGTIEDNGMGMLQVGDKSRSPLVGVAASLTSSRLILPMRTSAVASWATDACKKRFAF